jgi:hypothetical protein
MSNFSDAWEGKLGSYKPHKCPVCGDMHLGETNKKKRLKTERIVKQRLDEYLKMYPGAHKISVDGSNWFEWVDGHGNRIPGPKGV